MPKRAFISCCSLVAVVLLCSAAPVAPPPRKALVVVDRPRLDQKLRAVSDDLAALKEHTSGGGRVAAELLEDARLQIEQARAQLQTAHGADAWLSEQLEAMQEPAPPPPDAGVPPLRARGAWGTKVSLDSSGSEPAAPLPAGREPLGEVELHTMVNAMRGQEFRQGKLRVLAQAAPAYVFRVEQVIALVGEFSAPADRLEAFQVLVPHVVDKENAPVLYRACASEAERTLVQSLLSQ